MDVTRVGPRKARIAALGLGTAFGLVFALPVKTGSVACPPAGEGRGYCLLQHAWAPAAVKVAVAMLAFWLVAELLFVVLPSLRLRWARGERLVRREDGHGHDAVLADPVLTAANWGIVPERKTAWRVATPQPEPLEQPAAPAAPAVRALNAVERAARSTGRHGRHIRVLSAEEARGRRLRRGNDPALVVSCWSDASSARDLPDDVRRGAPA